MPTILKVIYDARAKWKEIGRELRFAKNDLDALNGDAGANLESVLLMWIRRGGATIYQLTDVLRSKLVHMSDLADMIENTSSPAERLQLGLQ